MSNTGESLLPRADTPEIIEDAVEPIVLDHPGITDTIIVSDLHLGSDVARCDRLLQLLRSYTFNRLILNGDVFDDLNFTRLTKADWKFLSYVRKLSNPRRGVEVVWVVGNHDGGVAEILSHLLGIHVHDEFMWNVSGATHLAIHGHQFDNWITDHVIITAIATWLYWLIQKIDPNHSVARWVKKRSKKFLRLSEKVGNDAVSYGKKIGANVIHCGHTHLPMHIQIDGATYVNSGCWTDKPSNYVTIDADGTITLRDCY